MVASLRTAIDDARSSAVPSSTARPSAGVVLALGRIEAKHLLRHPAFLLPTAFGLLLMRGAIGFGGSSSSMALNLAWLAGGVAIGILIGAVLTTNVAALRPRRDHLTELYGSLPAPAEARTAGDDHRQDSEAEYESCHHAGGAGLRWSRQRAYSSVR